MPASGRPPFQALQPSLLDGFDLLADPSQSGHVASHLIQHVGRNWRLLRSPQCVKLLRRREQSRLEAANAEPDQGRLHAIDDPRAFAHQDFALAAGTRGEALSPVREPIAVLESLKLQLGSDAFSAQYQQAPVPPGGAMIKRKWITPYVELPPASERFLTLQSWDTASKGGPENDFSVCTTWFVTRDKRWYLIDVWRKRVCSERSA